MKNIIVLLFVCSSWFVYGQNDTILLAFPEIGRINTEMAILDGNRYGIIQTKNEEGGLAPIVTDENGFILFQAFMTELEGFQLYNCSFMFEDSSSYYFIGNALKDSIPYYYSIKSEKNLSNFEVVDTLTLSNHSYFFVNMMKYNPEKHYWEGFGNMDTYISTSEPFEEIDYLALDSNFNIVSLKPVTGIDYPRVIMDLVWLPEIQSYFIVGWHSASYLVSADMVALELVRIQSTFFHNNITEHGYYFINNCIKHPEKDTAVLCFCTNSSPYVGLPTSQAMIGLTFADTVEIEVNDFNQVGYPDINFAPNWRIDSAQNYIFAGVNKFNLLGSNFVPNKLGVLSLKADMTFNWQAELIKDLSFAIWDFEIDKNGDIVMVGDSRNLISENQRAGFLLKLYKNGNFTLSSLDPDKVENQGLVLFPNPTTDFISIKNESSYNGSISLALYDQSGKKVLENNVMNLESRLYLGYLPMANYIYLLKNENGVILQSGNVIIK